MRRTVIGLVATGLVVLSPMILSQESAAARPTDLPVPPLVVSARADYATALAAANRVYRESQKSAQASYAEAIRLAGTKGAVAAAQAKALTAQAVAIHEARERYALALALSPGKAERKAAQAELGRVLAEIERNTHEALRAAARLIDPRFARVQAERVRAQALTMAAAAFEASRRAALSRLNEVLQRHGLPLVAG